MRLDCLAQRAPAVLQMYELPLTCSRTPLRLRPKTIPSRRKTEIRV